MQISTPSIYVKWFTHVRAVFKIISLVSKEMSVPELLVKDARSEMYLWDSPRAASAYASLLGND